MVNIPDIACRCTMLSEQPLGNGSSKSSHDSAGRGTSNSRFTTNGEASDVKAPNITLISFNKTNNL